MLFANNEKFKLEKGFYPEISLPVQLKIDDRFSDIVTETDKIGSPGRQFRRYSTMTISPFYSQNILNKGEVEFRYATNKGGTELSPVYRPDAITITDGFYTINTIEELFWFLNHPNFDDANGDYAAYTKGVLRRQPMFSIFDKGAIEKAKNALRKKKAELEQKIYNTDESTLRNYYLVYTGQTSDHITNKEGLENTFIDTMHESEIKYGEIFNLFSEAPKTLDLIIEQGFAKKFLTIKHAEKAVYLNDKKILEVPANATKQKEAKPIIKAYFEEEIGANDLVILKDCLS